MRFLRSAPILLLLCPLIALTPERAKAGDKETADVAVDLFVKGANAAGLPISTREATIIKEIVACGISSSKPDLGNCVANMVVKVALKELGADPRLGETVTCLASGQNAAICGAKAFVGNLPPEARPMADCLIGGGKVADCGQKLVEGLLVNKVPPDVQPVVQCMIKTPDPKACGAALVQEQVKKQLSGALGPQAGVIVGCLASAQAASGCVAGALPPELQVLKPLVDCVTSGKDAGFCMTDFAAKQLPADSVAKAMVECVRDKGADFGKCAQDKGLEKAKDVVTAQISEAEKQALLEAIDTINKLRPDAEMTIEAGPNKPATLRNILLVAQGIKEGKWDWVVRGAGPELAIIASNIILSIFLTPALASVLSPAVAAMIHNDVIAAEQALDAISRGDAIGLTQVIFKWYVTSFIDKPCAIIGDSVQKICGELSTVITDISEAGGDVAKGLLDKGKDILEWLGVWGTVDDVASFAWNTLKNAWHAVFGGGKKEWRPPPKCADLKPESYFANHYLGCIGRATGTAAYAGAVDTGNLDRACSAAFNECVHPEKRASVVPNVCGAMAKGLATLAKQASDASKVAADLYNQMGGAAKYVNDLAEFAHQDMYGAASRDFCDPNFWNSDTVAHYARKCEAFVSARFPMPKSTAAGGPACALPNSQPAAYRFCFEAAKANAGKNALVGPDSFYCERQRKWEADHPCTVTKTGKVIPIPGTGKVIEDITVNCKERRQRLDPFLGTGIDIIDVKWPDHRVKLPGSSQITPFTGRGSSGSYMIDGRTNEGTRERLKAGAAVGNPADNVIKLRPSRTQNPAAAVRPGGSSGSYLSSGGNRAMDSLSGDGMGGGFRGVGSSGSNSVVTAPNRKLPGGTGTSVINSRPGGSSGFNTSRPIGNNAIINNSKPMGSSGSNTSRSGGSSGTNMVMPSGPDRNINYGACPGCGRQSPNSPTIHPR